jgi:prepilin-type N-terminal cleavage/methylation domain-containing protein
MLKKNKPAGFTLIEIVIVIAIAAALILLVFLAVSGAQKSKRDQITKTSAGEVGAALENWESNNGGQAPAQNVSLNKGGATYITANMDDGLGGAPAAAKDTAKAKAGAGNEIIYSGNAQCVTDNGPGGFQLGDANNYAVDYWSESAGTDVCIDNN